MIIVKHDGAVVAGDEALSALEKNDAAQRLVYATKKFFHGLGADTVCVHERSEIADETIAIHALKAGLARLYPPLGEGVRVTFHDDKPAETLAPNRRFGRARSPDTSDPSDE